MIKLVTIDLDNTLLNKNKEITEYNKEIIKLARKKGVHIVLATGRPIEGVKDYLNILNMNTKDDYVICYNGGKIYNLYNNEIIHSEFITASEMQSVYKLSKNMGLYFHTFDINGNLYCPHFNHYTDIEATLNHIDCHIKDVMDFKDELFLKAMIVDSEENINYAYNHVPSEFKEKFNVVRSSKIFLEFLNKKVDKGNALTYLANYLNIDIKDTMAIGDASNDKGMIVSSGIGVAMSNAFPEILEIADYITTSCEESGVGYAINKFCLEQ
ncbi:MAG: Cof-type HAD-IIB family hydrolase [Anaeroplasmataceae bacterium]